jgi:hypothetical protein
LNSDNAIISFFKKKENLKYIILALVALFFILLGAGLGNEQKATADMSREGQIEARLGELCSSVKGVGKCKVMVYLEADVQKYSYAKENTRVSAVSIVCDGGDKESVRAALTDLISSLYGIGTNRISINKLSAF